jgi:flagellar biosynthetic protein FliR
VHFLGLSPAQFEAVVLIFARIATMLMVFPVISSPQVPRQLRFGLAALLTLILYRAIPQPELQVNFFTLIAGVAAQIFIGLTIGFVTQLVFMGVSFAGELIDLQIGFAIANVINPQTQQNITIIGELELALATLIFIATDSHYFLIQGIAGSFTLVHLPFVTLDPSVAGNLILFFTQAFFIVFRIAAPVVVALFMTNVGLAFMARVAPQMNVFVVGLPIQIAVGLTMMIISLPLLASVGPELFQNMAGQMDTVLRGLRPAAP